MDLSPPESGSRGHADGFSHGDYLGMGGNRLSKGLSAMRAVMDPFGRSSPLVWAG